MLTTSTAVAAPGLSLNHVIQPATKDETPAFLSLAKSTGVFSPKEIDCLEEDLDCYHDGQYEGDTIFSHISAGRTLGIAHFGPAVITDRTWFLHWIAVAKEAQGMGIGQCLLEHVEQEIRLQGGRLVLIETSSKSTYQGTRSFYVRCGYTLNATIADYYAEGEGKCVFSKKL